MSTREGFHHVALRAQNMQHTIDFYVKLGCSVIRSWGEGDKQGAMLDVGGGNILEIFAGGSEAAEEKPRFEHIALKSSDVEQDFANAIAAGAIEKTKPTEGNLGGALPIQIAFVIGPNQEVIEFFCEK